MFASQVSCVQLSMLLSCIHSERDVNVKTRCISSKLCAFVFAPHLHSFGKSSSSKNKKNAYEFCLKMPWEEWVDECA